MACFLTLASIISNNNTSSLILEKSLANNQTFEFTIDIDGTKPLSLTMAWTVLILEEALQIAPNFNLAMSLASCKTT